MDVQIKLLLSMLIMLLAVTNAVSQGAFRWVVSVYWVLVSIYWMVAYMGVSVA